MTNEQRGWFWFSPRSNAIYYGFGKKPPGLLRRLFMGYVLGWTCVIL